MPPYYYQPHPDRHSYPHHPYPHHSYGEAKPTEGHVRWPETPYYTTYPEKHDTTTPQQDTFNEIIKNIHEIINQSYSTIAASTELPEVEEKTQENLNIDMSGGFNDTLITDTPATMINAVTDILNVFVTEQETESEQDSTQFIYQEGTTDIVDNFETTIASVDYETTIASVNYETTADSFNYETTTEKITEATKEYFESTIKTFFKNDQGPNLEHGDHHEEKDHDQFYLILIIILSLLVILAAVALFFYIRYKKLSRDDECSPISIVGKTFHKRGIFTIQKSQEKQEPVQIKNRSSNLCSSTSKSSSMKDGTGHKPSKMDSVEFKECTPDENKINPR